MRYGGERLVGAVGWNNVGRSFDAIKVRYGGDSFVDFFNAKIQEKGLKDRNFSGLYGHLPRTDRVWEPYLFFEQDKNYDPTRMKRITLGLHATGQFTGATGHGFGYELEGAFQTGQLGLHQTGVPHDVMAWMATGALSYTSPSWYEYKAILGVDWLSGDDDPTDRDYKVFDTLFATNHKFYGFMDLFLNIPADTGQGGLVDVMLKGEMKTAPNTRLALHLHHFSLAAGAEKALGQEVDAVLSYDYSEVYALQGGTLVFVPGDAMKAMPGGGDELAFRVYLQTRVNF